VLQRRCFYMRYDIEVRLTRLWNIEEATLEYERMRHKFFLTVHGCWGRRRRVVLYERGSLASPQRVRIFVQYFPSALGVVRSGSGRGKGVQGFFFTTASASQRDSEPLPRRSRATLRGLLDSMRRVLPQLVGEEVRPSTMPTPDAYRPRGARGNLGS
jgi:hypothetical protein